MSASFVVDELSSLPADVATVPNAELVTCHPSMVCVRIRETAHKQVTVSAQFPEDYPRSPLLVELKSKTISERLLSNLQAVCDQELKKHEGTKQVLQLVKFVSGFIISNPFLVCYDELNHVKKELFREGDEIKVKQKAGILHYKALQGRYFMEFKLTVPHEYPTNHAVFEMKDSNFPGEIVQVFLGQAAEMARQCVQPPARKKVSDPPFSPNPSVQVLADYIIKECVRRYPLEKCPICNATALPEDPKDLSCQETDPKYVYRLYCGHLYHHSCLDTYMKTPPFSGGKRCLICNQRISHEKWNISPSVAEERWAHEQAKKREIAEVVDFLGL